ncbi:MAG: energy-coupling factor transporter ATPase [Bacillota bacterium]|nr:MAG: energy-coupling factor transporter ATPase [Bacillota bacterium]
MSIETVDLTHVYMAGTPNALTAVDRVSLRMGDGEAVGIMGPTGSGKSTLVQHFNGLLRPTSGRVLVDGEDLWRADETHRRGRKADLRSIRRKVGLIFQFPEHQLFEETVYEDIAFGPRNLGLGEAETRERVADALSAVGLAGDAVEDISRRSPFSLSGGQMRRVAIAGVLAMQPGTLVLDEPTAGLDPRGRRGLLEALIRLRRERNLTLIVVSHNMEDLASLTERVLVLDRGRVVEEGPTRQVFSRLDVLRELGLDAPPVVSLMQGLAARGAEVRTDLLDPAEAAAEIERWMRSKGGDPDRVHA